MQSLTPCMRTWGEVRNFAKSKISRDTGVCYMQEWFEQKNTEISSHKQACGVGTGVVGSQRYLAEVPESLFQTPNPRLFQNFWIRVQLRVQLFFNFENLTPVQTPATIIDPTVIYPCFYLRNGHTDFCCCRNRRVTPDARPVFPKFLTPVPVPDPKEKRRILPESTPVIWIRSHLWYLGQRWSLSGLPVGYPAG